MMRKILAVALVVAAAPVVGFAQCNKGGGRPLGGFGGTPIYRPPIHSQPLYSQPIYQPVGGSVVTSPLNPHYAPGGDGANCRIPDRVAEVPVDPAPVTPPEAVDDGSALDVLNGLFSQAPDTQRYNVEVRNPIGSSYKVVKSDLSIAQANALGSQLGEAFWVVATNGRGQRIPKMAQDRAAADSLSRTVVSRTRRAPSIESITYRIVPVQPEPATGGLSGLLDLAFEEPEPKSVSDVKLPALDPVVEPEPAATAKVVEEWSGVTVGADGQPVKFTLRLDADGTAEISVPNSEPIRSEYSVDGDQLVLTGSGGQKTVLGRIADKDDKRMTLVRANGQMTMFRQ